MQSEPSWTPMKLQSSARLRSIGFGLHSLVLRFSWTLAFFTPLPLITILRDSQLVIDLRPLLVSWSRATADFFFVRTLAALVRLRRSCWSKVEERALILTLAFFLPLVFRPLTLT